MALHAPLFLQTPEGVPEYNAEQMRVLTTLATNIGVEGLNDLRVTQRTVNGVAQPNLSVDVSPGQCVITGTEESGQGRYACESDAVTNVAIDPLTTPNSERIDRIVGQVIDPAVRGGSAVGWNIYAFKGAVAPPGQAPIPGTPASSMTFGRVRMTTNKAAVTNADITDERMFSRNQYVGLATSMQSAGLGDMRIGGAHTWWGGTVALPRIPGDIRVWAMVTGAFRSVAGTCWVWTRVHTSLDSGATWIGGNSMAGFSGSPLAPTPVANQHLVRARCTGEIRARVEVWSQVNMADIGGGVLVVHATPSPPNLQWGV